MNAESLKRAMAQISAVMNENREYLVELDSRNGDGDLGISMSSGYQAVKDYLATSEERDLGILLKNCSSVFNEAAPSSLGTITSFALLGIALNDQIIDFPFCQLRISQCSCLQVFINGQGRENLSPFRHMCQAHFYNFIRRCIGDILILKKDFSAFLFYKI